MRSPTLIVRLLLALCLLFAQQVLTAHAVAHVTKAARQDSAPGHEKLCQACVLSAQLNDVLLGQAALLLDTAPELVRSVVRVSVHVPRPCPPFHSRAPPVCA